MLSLANLTVSVAGKKIIDDLNFNFEKDKVYALMGPNGSGKSSLANTIAGHPSYIMNPKSKIKLSGENLEDVTPDKRAKKGIFLAFQTPFSLSGVTVFQLLRLALSGIKDPLAIRKEIDKLAGKLKIKKELITRSLNEGASGGERKKLELLQAIVLDAKFLIFDEIDTGVDVDALKIIATHLNKMRKGRTILLITHYNRILKYIRPDEVMIMMEGKIVKTGNHKLAPEIEKTGYEHYESQRS
jgi:Fe-S cluster assembly ATP-binding protein